jgi:hypothetical protein
MTPGPWQSDSEVLTGITSMAAAGVASAWPALSLVPRWIEAGEPGVVNCTIR